MRQVRINVYGRVQGVFFRHSARHQAENLGLGGWVRNEDDGSVSIVAEGQESALFSFIAWCHQGPPLARVDTIKTEWREPTGTFKKFHIT